jgi:hypothetical protein
MKGDHTYIPHGHDARNECFSNIDILSADLHGTSAQVELRCTVSGRKLLLTCGASRSPTNGVFTAPVAGIEDVTQ